MILRIVDLSNNYFLFFKYIYLTRITAIFTIIRKLLIRFMPHSTSSSILLAIARSFTKYRDRISKIYRGILCLTFLSIKTYITIVSIEKIINSIFISISLSPFMSLYFCITIHIGIFYKYLYYSLNCPYSIYYTRWLCIYYILVILLFKVAFSKLLILLLFIYIKNSKISIYQESMYSWIY